MQGGMGELSGPAGDQRRQSKGAGSYEGGKKGQGERRGLNMRAGALGPAPAPGKWGEVCAPMSSLSPAGLGWGGTQGRSSGVSGFKDGT